LGSDPNFRLARLLQLASPALPVGAYSYSQGLESAVTHGLVRDEQSAQRWIGDVLEFSIARMEAPLFFLCCKAWQEDDLGAIRGLNERFLASREAAELRAETVQMGYSLGELLRELGLGTLPVETPAFPVAFSYAAVKSDIEPREALLGYLWSWVENQVLAAVKAVPLGQTAGQRMLFAFGEHLHGIVERAGRNPGEAPGNFAPALALLAAQHETQYSRLFRS
jgi:urease accessory protein